MTDSDRVQGDGGAGQVCLALAGAGTTEDPLRVRPMNDRMLWEGERMATPAEAINLIRSGDMEWIAITIHALQDQLSRAEARLARRERRDERRAYWRGHAVGLIAGPLWFLSFTATPITIALGVAVATLLATIAYRRAARENKLAREQRRLPAARQVIMGRTSMEGPWRLSLARRATRS